ncbi:hypothetical protein FXO38_09077 [Capsicum annuum]|nr:hypothetical protein FXO38_09077 [Capsicum annuum]
MHQEDTKGLQNKRMSACIQLKYYITNEQIKSRKISKLLTGERQHVPDFSEGLVLSTSFELQNKYLLWIKGIAHFSPEMFRNRFPDACTRQHVTSSSISVIPVPPKNGFHVLTFGAPVLHTPNLAVIISFHNQASSWLNLQRHFINIQLLCKAKSLTPSLTSDLGTAELLLWGNFYSYATIIKIIPQGHLILCRNNQDIIPQRTLDPLLISLRHDPRGNGLDLPRSPSPSPSDPSDHRNSSPSLSSLFSVSSLSFFPALTIMEDTIYFAVRFKSFDVTRLVGTSGGWYEWTERGRSNITRTSSSKKSMEWIVQALQEASMVTGNSVKRWRKKDSISEIFCARNFNKYRRYISLINVRGRRKTVLIILEITFNDGWSSIADKVGRFLSKHKIATNIEKYRLVDNNIPFAERVKSITTPTTTTTTNPVYSHIVRSGEGVWREKSISSVNEAISLAEVKRWVTYTWKQAHGVKIYEMGCKLFLFEFPTRAMAEQAMTGDWFWKKSPVFLQWWNPAVGTVKEKIEINTVWIGIVGFPLHLWSQKVFIVIGDFCGGWVETEEETQLRNHLKWARIKIRGDGRDVLIEVTMENDRTLFSMPI